MELLPAKCYSYTEALKKLYQLQRNSMLNNQFKDETNNINVIIWKNIFEKYRASAVQGNLLTINGILEKKDRIIHVIAKEISDVSHFLEAFSLKSRDFH